jgi:hypothetical protein
MPPVVGNAVGTRADATPGSRQEQCDEGPPQRSEVAEVRVSHVPPRERAARGEAVPDLQRSVATPRSSDRLTTARVGRACRQPRCLDASRPEALRPRLATGLLLQTLQRPPDGGQSALNRGAVQRFGPGRANVSTWRRADLATADRLRSAAAGQRAACSASGNFPGLRHAECTSRRTAALP